MGVKEASAIAAATGNGDEGARLSPFFTSGWGVFLLCTFCCLLWGSAFPCIKLGYRLFSIPAGDYGSQLLFAGVRFFLAGVMVTAFMSVRRGHFLRPRVDELPVVMLLSTFQTIVQYLCFYVGLAFAMGTTSSIITASSNFFAILLSALAFRQERLTGRKLLGCALGFAGVVVVNLGSLGRGGFALGGEGLILLSALSGGLVTCLLRRHTQEHDPVMLSGWQFMLGGLVLAGLGLALGGHLSSPSIAGVLLVLYMGFISAAAYSVMSQLLSVNAVSRIAVFRFMTPVFGFLLSALLLGEAGSIDPLRSVLALVLVSAGIVVVNVAPGARGRAA